MLIQSHTPPHNVRPHCANRHSYPPDIAVGLNRDLAGTMANILDWSDFDIVHITPAIHSVRPMIIRSYPDIRFSPSTPFVSCHSAHSMVTRTRQNTRA